MVKAVWRGAVIAESDQTQMVEGNHYFPKEAVNFDYLRHSDMHSICPWKGEASYFDIVVDGDVNADAAWYYPDTKPRAKKIEGYIAFWRGVQIER